MDNLDKITEPGQYYAPLNMETVKPTIVGSMKIRDIGKYRLMENTDEHGKVTNWQKELPNGEWKQVDPIRGI